MNRFFTYFLCLFIAGIFGFLLLSCQNWDLPSRKSQRNCTKPAGTLNPQIQQLKVDFSISSSSGTIDKISWDFGNGNTSATTGTTVTYTYPTPGTYTIKSTLTNTCGQETVLSQTIFVSNAVLPTVSLQPITTTTNSATGVVTVTSNGNATITEYGICYSNTNTLPTKGRDFTAPISISAVINSPTFCLIAGLQPNTLYYARSYATNSANLTGYSDPVLSFRTNLSPSISTIGAATPSIFSATVNYLVSNAGNPAAVEYGVYFSSTTTTPDLNSTAAKVTNPPVGTNVVVTLPDLKPSTTYYYIAYARLPSGEAIYGTVMSFTTLADPVARDLVANIGFTEQSLLDITDYKNHVKTVGNPTFTTDRKGRMNAAIMLDGVDDYFYIPENPDNSLNSVDALSISVWIKPITLTRRMTIYNKSQFSTGNYEMYSSLLKLENDTGPGTTLLTDIKQNSGCQPGVGWQSFPITSQIPLNTWHHLVFTYTGNTIRMYLDGALLAVRDNLPVNKIDLCSGGDLKFGAQNLAFPWYFYGAMDDVRVYKRALSADEVKTLNNQ